MTTETTPVEVRKHLVDTLRLDFVGPTPDDTDHAQEVLPTAPTKWYLTGFLAPADLPQGEKDTADLDENLDLFSKGPPSDDAAAPGRPGGGCWRKGSTRRGQPGLPIRLSSPISGSSIRWANCCTPCARGGIGRGTMA